MAKDTQKEEGAASPLPHLLRDAIMGQCLLETIQELANLVEVCMGLNERIGALEAKVAEQKEEIFHLRLRSK